LLLIPEVQLYKCDMKENNNRVDVGLTSTKNKLTSEAIDKPNPKNTADKIVALSKNVCLNPEIRLRQFSMKECNSHVDDEPNPKKIKLSNEAIKLITKNVADPTVSFNNIVFLNPEIRLQKFHVKDYDSRIDNVGPNSNRNKRKKNDTRM